MLAITVSPRRRRSAGVMLWVGASIADRQGGCTSITEIGTSTTRARKISSFCVRRAIPLSIAASRGNVGIAEIKKKRPVVSQDAANLAEYLDHAGDVGLRRRLEPELGVDAVVPE